MNFGQPLARLVVVALLAIPTSAHASDLWPIATPYLPTAREAQLVLWPAPSLVQSSLDALPPLDPQTPDPRAVFAHEHLAMVLTASTEAARPLSERAWPSLAYPMTLEANHKSEARDPALAAIARPRHPTKRRHSAAAIEAIRAHLNGELDSDREAGLRLRLAELLATRGELAAAAKALEVAPESERYGALVAFQRAKLAIERRRASAAETQILGLLRILDADGRLLSIDSALVDEILLDMARSASGREDGWIRARDALNIVPYDVLERLRPELLAVFDKGAVPMNRARVRLFLAANSDESASLLEDVTAISKVAREIGGPPGAQLCSETFDLLERHHLLANGKPVVERIVERVVEACLATQRSVTRDPDFPDSVTDFYDRARPYYDYLFTADQRAHYGIALLDDGQVTFAAEQLLVIDADDLPTHTQAAFGRAAAELRYTLNSDIHLRELSCTLRRPQPLPPEDLTYLRWLELARTEVVEDAARYRFMEMELAILLVNGHYATAVDNHLEPLIAAATPDANELESAIDQLMTCLSRSDRWSEVQRASPILRRKLPADARDRVFERWGTAITEAHLALANAMDMNGNTEGAISMLLEFQFVWRANPDVTELLFTTGALLAAAGELDRAVIYFEEIYEEHATHELADDALFSAATALRAAKQPVAAHQLLDRITREHSTGEFAERASEALRR